jgi:hypothetical protein
MQLFPLIWLVFVKYLKGIFWCTLS